MDKRLKLNDKMNAIVDNDDVASREMKDLQKRQRHIGLDSPDSNESISTAHRRSNSPDDNIVIQRTDKEKLPSIPTISSDHNHTTPTQSSTNINSMAIITPNQHTPSPSTSPTSPLKSPFLTSMTLLDSKLESLKKKDAALNSRIENMSAWLLDGSMEDSFDGEVLFGDWDEGCEENVSSDGSMELSRLREQLAEVSCADDSMQHCCFKDGVDLLNANNECSTLICRESGKVAVVAEILTTVIPSSNDSPDDYGDDAAHHEILQRNAEANGVVSDETNAPSELVERNSSQTNHFISASSSINDISATSSSNEFDLGDDGMVSTDGPRKTKMWHDSEVEVCINENTDNNSCCKSPLRDHSAPSKHMPPNELAESESNTIQSKMNYEQKSSAECTTSLPSKLASDQFSGSENLPNSIRAIGKISYTSSTNHSSVPDRNQTLFFSPVETSQSQIYLTPYSRNVSLESKCGGNIFGPASTIHKIAENSVMNEADTLGRSVLCKKGFRESAEETAGTARTTLMAPSLCLTDASTRRVLWEDQSSCKSEAVVDLTQTMDKLVVDPSSNTQHDKIVPTSVSRATSKMSPTKSTGSTLKHNSSPIQPKKLYKFDGVANSNPLEHADGVSVVHALPQEHNLSVQDDSCTVDDFVFNAKVISARHSFFCKSEGANDEESQQFMLVVEEKDPPKKAPVCTSTADKAEQSSSILFNTEAKSLSSARKVDRAVSDSSPSENHNDHIFDSKERNELRALVAKLQNQLAEVTSERDAAIVERDGLVKENSIVKTAKCESEALIGKLEAELTLMQDELSLLRTDLNAKETEFANNCNQSALSPKIDEFNQLPTIDSKHQQENSLNDSVISQSEVFNAAQTAVSMMNYQCQSSSFISDESELEEAIELVVSSAKNSASADSSCYPNSCKACTEMKHCVKRITLLTLENSKLKAQLDASHLTPVSPYCYRDTTETPSTPRSERARPVDLETFFRATPRRNKVDSTTPSYRSQSDMIPDLKHGSEETIRSRDTIEEMHDHLTQQHHKLEKDLHAINAEENSVIGELEQTTSLVSLLESSQESLSSCKLNAEQERNKLKSQAEYLAKKLRETKSELELTRSKLSVSHDTVKTLEDKIRLLEIDRDCIIQKLTMLERESLHLQGEIDLICDEKNRQEKRIKELLINLTTIEGEKAKLEETMYKRLLNPNSSRQQQPKIVATVEKPSKAIENANDQILSASECLEDAESQSQLATRINDNALDILCKIDQEQKAGIVHFSNAFPTVGVKEKSPFSRSSQLPSDMKPFASSPLSREHLSFHTDQQSFGQDDCPTNQDRFRSIASILSVIVLQQKLRAARAETKLQKLGDKLADAEISIGELNLDRERLIEVVTFLKKENQALIQSGNIMSRQPSEALVLESESCVETVDCTMYSSTQIHQAKSEISLSVQKLQSTIGSLALALVKLKIREKSLLNENKKLAHNLTQLHTSTTHFSQEVKRLLLENQNLEKQASISICQTNELKSQNSELLLENNRVTTIVTKKNQEIDELKQQIETISTQLASAEEHFINLTRELKKCHEREKQENAELILKSGADDGVNELKFYLLHEKEASSLLRVQLENSSLENEKLEVSIKALEEERQEEKIASTSLLRDYEEAVAKLKSCQSELELSEKFRVQLQSQLGDETYVLNQTVISQAATIEKLNVRLQTISHERDADRNALSSLNCKFLSLASERDSLLAKLTVATNEYNVLRSENTNLKHEHGIKRNEFERSDCSVKTYSSCEHVGTVCEEQRPALPDTDIIDILSAPQLSKKDIEAVSDKMRQLHIILSQVQEERSSLQDEVKHLREFKESSSDLVSREEVELLLRKNSESFRSQLIHSQNEILRLARELESRNQPRITKFTTPFSTAANNESARPQFEVSLETPRATNMASAKHTSKLSPRYRQQKSPKEWSKVRSKERFEVKSHSIFNLFKDSKKSGRKEFIKYRDIGRDSRSVNSSEPISPGEKRKREQAELMIKSLRRKYETKKNTT